MNAETWIMPLAIVGGLLAYLMVMRGSQKKDSAFDPAQFQSLFEKLDRMEKELRYELTEAQRAGRVELQQNLAQFQKVQVDQLKSMGDTLYLQLNTLSESNARRMSEVRTTLDTQLQQMQQTNLSKLEEMRQTVDEKLQTTLETRLSESFKQVAERLEQVHQGLGQMTTLAQGVGDLQRVLSNVKSRGIFGEVQLEALLEQVLTNEQYGKQVETVPRSNQRVDFAIKLPGRFDDGDWVWLPIDAKFPREDYERLLDAHDRSDTVAAEISGKALEARIKSEAKSIAENYLAPPHTTDFASLFLPVEGLYEEVLRRPGLMDSIQREHRVTLAGPTTLLAILNSLQMGFRTLALEKQASEVWKVLGAVKTEFDRYGEWVEKVREQVHKASDTLDRADTRSKQMRRVLKNIEALPDAQVPAYLPPAEDGVAEE